MLFRSLRHKILFAMVGAILAVAVMYLAYFVYYVGDLIERSERNDGLALVSVLAQSAELGVLTENLQLLAGPFRGIMSNPSTLYVVAYDREGRVIKAESIVDINPALPLPVAARIKDVFEPFVVEASPETPHDAVEFYAPVVLGLPEDDGDEFMTVLAGDMLRPGAMIGVVRVGFSRAAIIAVKRRVVIVGLIAAAAVCLIMGLIAAALSKRIARPLAALRDGAARIAAGERDLEVHVASRDEVGELAAAFNRMIRELGRTTVSRNYLDNIMGSMIDTLIVIDADGVIRTVNPATLHLLGYDEAELIGQRIEFIMHDPGILGRAGWRKFIEGGTLENLDVNYRTKGGEAIPMRFSGSVMLDRRTGSRSIVGIAHDIRETKRLMMDLERRRNETEQARYDVEREKRRLEFLLGALNEGVVMFDPSGEVVIANAFARGLMRLGSDDEVTRERLRAIEWLPLDDMMDELGSSEAAESYREVELSFPVVQVVRMALSEVRAESGRLIGHVFVMQDVTEERELDRMKDEFVVAVSHDLRTPLTTIKGFVSLLLDGRAGPLGDKQRQFLENANESAQHLHAMINELLDLSRIQAGKLVMTRRRVDVRSILGEAVRLNEPAARSKRLTLGLSMPDASCEADIDVERMKEVINNLIGNAMKYTPEEGSVNVTLAARDGELEMTVRDTGPGIPHLYHQTIFEKFRSVPGRREESSLSSGLGLSIVKGIVEAHGGHVWVESEEGKGAAFIVVIPRQPPT